MPPKMKRTYVRIACGRKGRGAGRGDPAQLDMGVPSSSTSAALVLEGAVAEVVEQQVPLTAGLASYQRAPTIVRAPAGP